MATKAAKPTASAVNEVKAIALTGDQILNSSMERTVKNTDGTTWKKTIFLIAGVWATINIPKSEIESDETYNFVLDQEYGTFQHKMDSLESIDFTDVKQTTVKVAPKLTVEQRVANLKAAQALMV